MSSGHVVISCRYFESCGNAEEFPDEIAPPDYLCDSCFALVSMEG